MQDSHDEKIAPVKTSISSMSVFILSIACFIVLLWVITIIVRFIAGLGAS